MIANIGGRVVDACAQPRESLTQYLEFAAACGPEKPPQGYAYRSIPEFLLKHGQWFEPAPLPANIRRGIPRRCFVNSFFTAKRRGYWYTEGFAVASFGFPTYHAWMSDDEGRALEVTWPDLGLAYFGVQFSLERAVNALLASGSVLDDMKRRFPVLRKPWRGERSRLGGPHPSRQRRSS